MSTSRPVILVIEDEAHMRRFLNVSLTGNGYHLIEAQNAEEGVREAASRNPDLVLLDLGLPDRDGITVTERIREWSKIPIIVVSARGQEQDKIRALDAGADDYVTKPFGVGELLARVRVALRRSARTSTGDSRFVSGDVEVDLDKRRVTRGGDEIHLTPIEYNLLVTLIKNVGRVMTHSQLLEAVWGPNSREQIQYLRVYMAQLRHKLEVNPSRPVHLLTEAGVGYRFRADE